MVFNRKMIAVLGSASSDVLFDFLEVAFCGIKLNHLLCRKGQIRCDRLEREFLVIGKHNFDTLGKYLKHVGKFGEFHRTFMTMDAGNFCGCIQLNGGFFNRSKTVAEFGMASLFAWKNQQLINMGILGLK